MPDDLWHKHSIIYSLDLETFMDGNGDGVGDFEGLNRRLDYLQNLGVDVIWLAPFQPTPNRDNGYDISDYYGVDPRHGSSGDFVEFMHQAKGRGLKVIIDLVVNHTSDQHRWFQQSRSDPDSQFRDWYVWSKKRPKSWNEGMVFPGHQESTWTRDKEAGMYYFHRFYEFQPDLNMQNPAVREEIRRVIGFWLELGVGLGMVGFAMSEDNLARFLAHPLGMVCSDGGAFAVEGPARRGHPHRRRGVRPRRGAAGVFVYKGKVYMVCGIQDGHWDGHVAWMDEYDPKTNQWKKLPDAPHVRDHVQAVVIDDKVYVAGGRRSTAKIGQVLNLTETAMDVFDFKTGKWTTLSRSPSARSAFWRSQGCLSAIWPTR